MLMSDFESVVAVRSMFEQMGFIDDFKIAKEELVRFTWKAHYFYSRFGNPFHNFSHAINVCHAGCYFLMTCPSFSSILAPVHRFAFIVACLGHDLDHRGKTNPFEIGTSSDLAIRYFDSSPLENHHAATLFSILSSNDSNILKNVPDDKLKDIKLSIIENILATDMKLHFPLLAEFKKKLADSPEFCKLG